jgi:hypothetical protein
VAANSRGIHLRIAILDTDLDANAVLGERASEKYDFILHTRPPASGNNANLGKCALRVLGSTESAKASLLTVLQELFATGDSNTGPILADAACSFLSATDYSLYMNLRHAYALFAELAKHVPLANIHHLSLFTDSLTGGNWRVPLQILARELKIRLYLSYRHGCKNLKEYVQRHVPERIYLEARRIRQRHWDGQGHVGTADSLVSFRVSGQRLCVAMMVYHPKSTRHLFAVREELIALGHEVVFISPRREVGSFLDESHVPYVSLPPAAAPRSLKLAVIKSLRQIPLLDAESGQPDEVARQVMSKLLVELALRELEVYATCSVPFGKLFRSGRVQLAVGTDSGTTAGRCFFRSAEHLGIKTAFVQHGSFSVAADVAPYFTKATLFTWGESSRRQLLDSGVPHPDRILAFGSPFEESRLTPATPVKNASRRLVVVMFGRPGNLVSVPEFTAAGQEVVAAANALPECDFVCKPHPGDHSSVWNQIIAAAGARNVAVRRDADTYDLLQNCDILITMFSTTGAEGIYLGKPVISVNLRDFPSSQDYIREGAAYEVHQLGELLAMLQMLLASPDGTDTLATTRRQFAERLLHRESMPAAQRMSLALEQLVPSA